MVRGQEITALIHTLNEEANLPSVLQTVRWCDEVVVVDMESDDRTQEIARAAGARVVPHPRAGFVEPARAFGAAACETEWVFIVDADELVPVSLARVLRSMSLRQDVDVVWVPRRNFNYGGWIRHGAGWPDAYPRFFRKGTLVFDDRIHSKPTPVAGARVTSLEALPENAIVHLRGSSILRNLRRNLHYAEIEARQRWEAGERFRLSQALWQGARGSLGALVYKKGFHDGGRGVVAALANGLIYSILMSVQLWERSRGVDFAALRAAEHEALLREWREDADVK